MHARAGERDRTARPTHATGDHGTTRQGKGQRSPTRHAMHWKGMGTVQGRLGGMREWMLAAYRCCAQVLFRLEGWAASSRRLGVVEEIFDFSISFPMRLIGPRGG